MTKLNNAYDVAIVGGGPGGLAAALWCGDLGLRSILIEQETELGGQLHKIHNPVANYPGVETANGTELADLFVAQTVRSEQFAHHQGAVANICKSDDGFLLNLSDGESIESKSVVIATGVRRRTLGVPGEMEFAGRGILDSGAGTGVLAAGLVVAIIGGGDAALENALILGRHAKQIYVIHRGDQFSARGQFIDAAGAIGNVEFIFGAIVRGVTGDQAVRGVDIELKASGEKRSLAIDNLLIRIGVQPNSKPFVDLATTSNGYIIADGSGRSSVSRIFAIGDVANPSAPTIAGAVGQAATAIKTLYKELAGQ